jgi:hypothetical protein
MKFPFLHKGQGKLASDNHGVTAFAIKRKEKIIAEQLEREKKPNLVDSAKDYTSLAKQLHNETKQQHSTSSIFHYFNSKKSE